jgi:hypothetical protein
MYCHDNYYPDNTGSIFISRKHSDNPIMFFFSGGLA